jgi:hypothetical protein
MSACRWFNIMSVANRSGKMSVHERTDVEHKGTDKVTGLERGIGAALVNARDCRSSWGKRAPGVRLLAAYRKEGVAALAHGNRGGVPFGSTSFAAPDSNSKLTPKTPEASSKSKLYNFGLKDAHEHRVE